MNVFIVGKVSSGKSSLLNSIVGGFITGTSLLRDTVKVTKYKLSQNGKELNLKFFVDNLHNENEYKQEFLSKNINDVLTNDMTSKELPILWKFSKKMPDIYIYDFPGFDDSKDSNKVFFTKFEKMYTEADLVLYVTDINSAFRDASEITLFDQIRNLINIHNSKGNFIGLNVVLNKYDDPEDNDHETICDDVCKLLTKDVYPNCKIKLDDIYRYSSHNVFICNAALNSINIHLPKVKEKAKETVNIPLPGILPTVSSNSKKSIKNKTISHSEFENKILKIANLFSYTIEYTSDDVSKVLSKEKLSINTIYGDHDYLIRNIIIDFYGTMPQKKLNSSNTYNSNLLKNLSRDKWYKDSYVSYESTITKLHEKELPFKMDDKTALDRTILEYIALNIQYVNNNHRFVVFEIIYDYLTKSTTNIDKLLEIILPHIKQINYCSLCSLFLDTFRNLPKIPNEYYSLLLRYCLSCWETYIKSDLYVFSKSKVQTYSSTSLIEVLKISNAPKPILKIYNLYSIKIEEIVAILYLSDLKEPKITCPYYSNLYKKFIANLKYLNYSFTIKKTSKHNFYDLFKPFYDDEHKKLIELCENFTNTN